ncbi:MAG: ATP phosphoribosyltransferase [Acidimicrobiaceae bacterium]|nr:ATP phosphoribosyltransferase [Acidimicrobiaceae bacterium]
MLRLVLPKGSLEKSTMELFASAGLLVSRGSDVDYKGTINDPRVESVRILRPQEIGRYVADGLFDLGITGRDWIEETQSEVESLGQLRYSKNTERPVRIVVAVPSESPWSEVSDLPEGVKVSTEYPTLTSNYFMSQGVNADIQLSYGATEAKVPEIVDAVVDITETGRALKAAGLKILDTILTSHTELIANPASFADQDKRKAMDQIRTLLQGVLDARGKVMVKMNVLSENLDEVIGRLPSMKSPTVNELSTGDGFAVETVVEKDQINILIPDLRSAGATDIIELPISKIVP